MTRKVAQTGLVLVGYQSSLVGVRTQDYKSLCAAVTICAALINIQTHTHRDSILISLYEKLSWLSRRESITKIDKTQLPSINFT